MRLSAFLKVIAGEIVELKRSSASDKIIYAGDKNAIRKWLSIRDYHIRRIEIKGRKFIVVLDDYE